MTDTAPVRAAVGTPAAESAASSKSGLRSVVTSALQLAVLSSLAIGQPLFDVLAKNAAFFAVRRSTPGELVAFTLAVLVFPPTVFIAAELTAALVDRSIGRALHYALVCALVGLIVLQVQAEIGGVPTPVAVVLALAIGGLGALALARLPAARTMLILLAPAPLIFAGLFLLNSPVKKLILPSEAAAQTADRSSDTPVVMVVLDEFSATSLLDRRERIDAARYPNLAALARESTWYRNATTVSPWTEKAVPVLLSGRYPDTDKLPILSDYPVNLFTLLAGNYDLNVHEVVTNLCPPAQCPEARRGYVTGGFRALLTDAAVLYPHVVLPADLAAHFPPVGMAWGDFLRHAGGHPAVLDPASSFRAFIRSIEPTSRPTLHFVHVLLPHTPWRYLPSGKPYLQRRDSALVRGADAGRWRQDRWLVWQAQQRYLLQVGFVDRLIGELVERLRSNGMYERSLVVVTADHGISFHPGSFARAVTPATVEDIAFTPLFVKAPGQRRGRVDDRQLESVDVLPTMLDLLDLEVPSTVVGRSATGPPRSRSRRPLLDGRRWGFADLLARRRRALADRLAVFGDGDRGSLFAFGAWRSLVGRQVDPSETARQGALRAEVDNAALYRFLARRAGFVPAYVSGRLEGRVAHPGQVVAIAVNRRIAATTRTSEESGEVRFGALVPESAFHPGLNAIDVFAVNARRGRARLVYLGGTAGTPTFVLAKDAGSDVIRSSAGRPTPVRPGVVTGHLDIATVEAGQVRLAGWAARSDKTRVRDRILVFVDGRFVYAFDRPMRGSRPDLGPRLQDAGFDFRLPVREVLPDGQHADVRLFAIVGGVASELIYPPTYPW